jgi:preprotein translocase subunit SecB
MVEAKSAAFRFTSFKIPIFSYNESGNEKSMLNLNFTPRGKYIQKDGIYELVLEFLGCEDGDKQIIYVKCVAYFEFEKDLPLADIPGYFYKNAIAIVFPYLRSFISSLTLQANSGLILLGLMNLSNLEEPLKLSTISE